MVLIVRTVHKGSVKEDKLLLEHLCLNLEHRVLTSMISARLDCICNFLEVKCLRVVKVLFFIFCFFLNVLCLSKLHLLVKKCNIVTYCCSL